MTTRHWNRRILLGAILLGASTALGVAASAGAAELDKLDTSLKLIPDEAVFYSSFMRGREQFDAVRHSNAWAKIEHLPVVQMALAKYREEAAKPDSGAQKVDAALKNPETRKLIDFAADMVSDDVFTYGDDSCIDFVQLAQNVGAAVRFGQLDMQVDAGEIDVHPSGQPPFKAILRALAHNIDLVNVPNCVVGFKIKNIDLAKEQLIKLEMAGNFVFEMNETTKGHFKKTKVGNHDFLVLRLDGSMLPWEQMPVDRLKEAETRPGDAQKIIDRVKASKLVMAVGIRDNYLLASIGSSLECLEKLGQGKRLMDRGEFKPLAKYADKRLTSIGYASKELNQQINNQRESIDNLLRLVDKALPLAKLTEQQQQRIKKDAAALAADIKRFLPKAGAQMGLSFLCERGIESCQYNWGDIGRLDSSKPLGLLQHVGGNPIVAIVGRAKTNVADYDLLVKWIKVAYGYVEDLALPAAPEKERERVRKFLATAMPLFQRLDKVSREKLIPALADGQSGIAIDAKLSSKQFVKSLPATTNAMPMIEPAIIKGVSDAKLLKEAMGEYREIANGLLDAVRQIEGNNVPANLRIPEPAVTTASSGTLYSFKLPEEWGVDEKIMPTLGLSDKVAVVTSSRDHAERLLAAAPPANGRVANADRPMAVAGWLDWSQLVRAATPWVDFAVDKAAADNGKNESEKKAISDQVHTGLDVLRTLQYVAAESYAEDGALVSHAVLEIHDVPK